MMEGWTKDSCRAFQWVGDNVQSSAMRAVSSEPLMTDRVSEDRGCQGGDRQRDQGW